VANGDPYRVTSGWAVIVGIHQPGPLAYSEPDGVEVVFDFTPDDPTAPTTYRFPEVPDQGQHLTVGSGANPSRTWVEEHGLLPGSRHRCQRRELGTGVGPPVLFEFPGLDTGGPATADE